jgi:hypothetical protein
MSSKKCRAANPAVCPYHRENFLVDKMFKKYQQSGGWAENIDIWKQSVSDIVFCLTDKDFLKMKLNEEEIASYIDNNNLAISWDRGDKNTYYNVPLAEMVKEVSYLMGDKRPRKVENNYLVKPTKKDGTTANYNYDMAQILVKKAEPVLLKPDVYAWNDYEMGRHVAKCGYSSITDVKESGWTEFTDTFNDESDEEYDSGYRYGVEASAVCNCGRFDGTIRLQETFSDLLRDLLSNKK